MDFVKDHLVRVADTNESGDEGEHCDNEEDNLVRELAFIGGDIGRLCELLFNSSGAEVLLARDVPLAQAVLGGA